MVGIPGEGGSASAGLRGQRAQVTVGEDAGQVTLEVTAGIEGCPWGARVEGGVSVGVLPWNVA